MTLLPKIDTLWTRHFQNDPSLTLKIRFSGLFMPPHFADEEQNRIAKILYTIGITILAGFCVSVGYRLIAGQLGDVLIMCVVILVLMFSLPLTRRGALAWSSSLILWTLYIFINYMIYRYDGTHDSGLLAIPGLLVLAVMVLKRNQFFVFAFAFLVSLTCLGYMEITGWVHSPFSSRTRYLDIIDLVLMLSVLTFSIQLLASNLIESLRRAWQSEKEVTRLNYELERRIRERTSELEAANKELESFSYSVSHDLRAPLRAIHGYSQAVLEDYAPKLDEEGMNLLSRICSRAVHMGELIDDMLRLSRVMRLDMNYDIVDLSAMAESIATNLRHSDPARNVELKITPNIVARGDAQLLRIAMENLLSNAWKFTGKHEAAKIEFGITSREEKSVYYVSDDGAGFDATYAGKMFGAFQRMHSASEFPGTGVGLATVQRIINRHGGKIWAEGAVELGARFYFTIPV